MSKALRSGMPLGFAAAFLQRWLCTKAGQVFVYSLSAGSQVRGWYSGSGQLERSLSYPYLGSTSGSLVRSWRMGEANQGLPGAQVRLWPQLGRLYWPGLQPGCFLGTGKGILDCTKSVQAQASLW